MAEGSGYGGFSEVPYPYWLSPPSPHHPASAPPFLTSYPVAPYDPTQGGFDPLISNGSYHRSPLGWSNNGLGNFGPRGEDSYKDLFPRSGFFSSRESSADVVTRPGENFSERQHLNFVPINSTTSASVPSLAEMMFYKPTETSGVYASNNTFDEKLPGHYRPGYVNVLESMNVGPGPPVEPYTCVTDSIPTLPMSSLKTESLLGQTGIHSGEGRSLPSNGDVCSHAPETLIGGQSSMYSTSVEPVNFDVLLGYNEATGHMKPLSENPDLRFQVTDLPGSRSPRSSHPLQLNINPPGSLFKDKLEGSGVSSLYQRPYTLIADSGNGVSESSLTNEIEYLNCDEHRSWNHFTVSSAPTMFSVGSQSCVAMKSGNGNAQAVNCKAAFEGSADQRSEDGDANQKPRKLHEERSDMVNRDYKTTLYTDLGFNGSSRSNEDDVSTGRSPQKDLCDQGDFPSPTSPRVSSVVNAMQNLSEVLVYECFNNRNCLKLEQLENLDKVVDNLSKCLKKFTDNKTIAGEASLPTQDVHVSCPNAVNLSEAPKEIAKDFKGFSVEALDSSGLKEPVDKNDMTQRIKNVLASNFPDGEEDNPQTLLYKNLWLETEATLCSTTCMARYHRIKNEIGSLKLHNKDISADGSTFMQEPSLNPHKSVPLMNNLKQETTESPIKQGSNSGNNLETKSYDAPQISRFNLDHVEGVISLLSGSFTSGFEQTIHENFKPDAATSVKIPDAIQQESPTSTTENKPNDVVDWFQLLKNQETKKKLKSENCPEDVIDRFQILKQQETKRKLKSPNCLETKVSDLENNSEDWEMARFGRSSQVSDVMDRFQILKRREAEQVQKSLSRVEIDSDSDKDQPRSNTPMRLASLMKELCQYNQTERCVDAAEPSANGNGCESPTSDWEHVLKDV